MPDLQETRRLEGFKKISQRLGVTSSSFEYRLTQGWTVVFSIQEIRQDSVDVCFYYNGKMGVDERSLMFVMCDPSTIENLFIEAMAIASTNIKENPKQYKGCYGVAVYRELCKLRDKEAEEK